MDDLWNPDDPVDCGLVEDSSGVEVSITAGFDSGDQAFWQFSIMLAWSDGEVVRRQRVRCLINRRAVPDRPAAQREIWSVVLPQVRNWVAQGWVPLALFPHAVANTQVLPLDDPGL